MKTKRNYDKISSAESQDDERRRAAEGYMLYAAEAKEFAEAMQAATSEAWAIGVASEEEGPAQT